MWLARRRTEAPSRGSNRRTGGVRNPRPPCFAEAVIAFHLRSESRKVDAYLNSQGFQRVGFEQLTPTKRRLLARRRLGHVHAVRGRLQPPGAGSRSGRARRRAGRRRAGRRASRGGKTRWRRSADRRTLRRQTPYAAMLQPPLLSCPPLSWSYHTRWELRGGDGESGYGLIDLSFRGRWVADCLRPFDELCVFPLAESKSCSVTTEVIA